jgi:hypothetical protein
LVAAQSTAGAVEAMVEGGVGVSNPDGGAWASSSNSNGGGRRRRIRRLLPLETKAEGGVGASGATNGARRKKMVLDRLWPLQAMGSDFITSDV